MDVLKLMGAEGANIWREKMACAYFFVVPALAYGILSSRLPAIRNMAGTGEGGTGALLLALGGSTLAGLFLGSVFAERMGIKNTTAFSAVLLSIAVTLAGLAINFWQIAICLSLAGICVGFCDVAVNAQGIFLEQRHKILCMSFLHAVCSLGGVAGSLSGALFAALGLSPFLNFLIVLGGYSLLWPLAFRNTTAYSAKANATPGARRHPLSGLPPAIFVLGVMSLLCHIAEGSAGEWGSILLHSIKGAPEQEAALVFAVFTGAMVICRFAGDRLRKISGDFRLVFYGSIMGAIGMAIVLLSPWPVLCLAGYALAGLGLGPVAPVLFSIAGGFAGVTPAAASSVISIFSYAGLLFFPPLLGMFAHFAGLQNALWVIPLFCAIMAVCSFAIHAKK